MDALYQFQPGHEDLVHDLAYDFFGQRLATCSSDQRIKVWEVPGGGGGGGVGGGGGESRTPLVDDGTAGRNRKEVVDDKSPTSPWKLNDSWKVCVFRGRGGGGYGVRGTCRSP